MRAILAAALLTGVSFGTPASAAGYDVVSGFGSSPFSYSAGSDDGAMLTPGGSLAPISNCFGLGSALTCYAPSGSASDSPFPLVAKNVSGGPLNFETVTVPVNELLLHPGNGAAFNDPIVTFTAPTAGTYTISGAFTRLDNTTSTGDLPGSNGLINNGVFAQIYKTLLTGTSTQTPIFLSDGLFGANVKSGTEVSFDLPEYLNAGDQIAFAIANGGQYYYDSTGLRATISTGAVPEPATWAMMVLGFGAVGFGLRRRRTSVRVTYA